MHCEAMLNYALNISQREHESSGLQNKWMSKGDADYCQDKFIEIFVGAFSVKHQADVIVPANDDILFVRHLLRPPCEAGPLLRSGS